LIPLFAAKQGQYNRTMNNACESITALSRGGEIFRVSSEKRLVKVAAPDLSPLEAQIRSLTKIEYFHHPFSAIAAVSQTGKIVSIWKIHPNTFYPLTPLDFIDPISDFYRGVLPTPVTIFTDLTDKCNLSCNMCFARGKRESLPQTSIPTYAYLETLRFVKSSDKIFSQGISGGGEPSIHPDFLEILDYSGRNNISTFVTTNGSRSDAAFIRSISQNTSVLVFSLQGVSNKSYGEITGSNSGSALDSILKNIQAVIRNRGLFDREKELLIGVNSIVHPNNSGYYFDFVRRLVGIGVDFIHFNPVLPSLKKYGLHFNDFQTKKTQEEFSLIFQQFGGAGTFIRAPERIFLNEGTYYFDPHLRKNPDVCLVSLLQPCIIPSGKPDQAIVATCRFHPNTTENPNFWYTDNLGPTSFKSIWTLDNLHNIQIQTSKCAECCSERQVMALDWMLHVMRSMPEARDFYLLFDSAKENDNVLRFYKTIENSYNE